MGLLGSITGSDAAKAAKKASKAMQAAYQKNIGDFRGAYNQNEGDLQPFVNLERDSVNRLAAFMDGDYALRDIPGYSAELDDTLTNVNKAYATTGKSLSGDRLMGLRDANLGVNNMFYNRLLGLSQPTNTNNLINLRNNMTGNVANSRIGKGEAYGAGVIGAANARSAGVGNMLKLASMAAPAVKGIAGKFGGSAGFGGSGYSNLNPFNSGPGTGLTDFNAMVPKLPF